MTATNTNMVLRTVYLPKALDLQLRDHAAKHSKSKGEFLLDLITEALAARAEIGDVPVGDDLSTSTRLDANGRIEVLDANGKVIAVQG